MVDIATVAQRAGVSTATVSRALNGKSASPETRRRVLEAAEELGYVRSSSASSLARGHTRTIGYTAPFLERWYFAELLKGIEAELVDADYDLLVYSPPGAEQEREVGLPALRRRDGIDGLIVASVDVATDAVYTLRTLGKPIVTVGSPLEGAVEIHVDDVGMARTATEHLLSLGHTRIGHLGAGTNPEYTFRLGERRYQGWSEALRAAGIAPDRRLDRHCDYSVPAGYEAAKSLFGLDRPTAVVADSDEIAIGAILAARDLGLRVPDDVSVVGIDDHSLAAFFGLTTVAQRPAEQGRTAARLVLAAIEERPITEPATAGWELVVRSSTRRLGAPLGREADATPGSSRPTG